MKEMVGIGGSDWQTLLFFIIDKYSRRVIPSRANAFISFCVASAISLLSRVRVDELNRKRMVILLRSLSVLESLYWSITSYCFKCSSWH